MTTKQNIERIKSFLKSRELPVEPFRLNDNTIVNDTQKLVKLSLNRVENNPESSRVFQASHYLLKELCNYLKNIEK